MATSEPFGVHIPCAVFDIGSQCPPFSNREGLGSNQRNNSTAFSSVIHTPHVSGASTASHAAARTTGDERGAPPCAAAVGAAKLIGVSSGSTKHCCSTRPIHQLQISP